MIRNLWQVRRSPAGREELAALLPAPDEPVLPPDRRLHIEEHLMRELTLEQDTRQESALPAAAPPRRRNRRLALVAAPLAVAVAAGVGVVVQSSEGDGGTATAPAAGPLTLAQAIDRIALTALEQQLPVPGPDEFVYLESRIGRQSEGGPDGGLAPADELHRLETWLSPDGQEGWLIEQYPEPANDQEAEIGGGTPGLINPSYDFLASLPTDPDALLDLIYEDGWGEGIGPDQRAFDTIGRLLREHLVPPELAAALFRAAERIPGVFLDEDVTDAAGEPAFAVARAEDNLRIELIFDEESFAYLAERVVMVEDGSPRTSPGTTIRYFGFVRVAIVDELRERP
ncbi:CU044_5270 family protein [Streptomyces sp. B6B3]|uniref:CU044_5270 family protein n=1 Tax=Streptomyces sp. B6B3 TaxID=3153570 RepID=UPI00325E7B04